jgi:hypothetical protein
VIFSQLHKLWLKGYLKMKSSLLLLSALLVIAPAAGQQIALVRGIGTQTCKTFVAATEADKPLASQASQWILGNLTGYFRQAGDDPTRTLGDSLLVKTVIDICAKNAEKTIDEAVSIAITALPVSEIKKPDK